jgi:hypothetical protein
MLREHAGAYPMTPKRSSVLFLCAIAAAAMWFCAGCRSAMATPVFAQAYGLNCTACHTQMPALNAFGRYIQRTGYGALDSKTLAHAVPVFVFDIGTSYVRQGGQPNVDNRINGPFHDTVVQADSAIGPDVTYKIEQLLSANGQSGFLDQAWVGYHDILNRSGHLFVGKLAALNLEEFGAPSVLYDVNDAGGDRIPGVAVGAHNYGFDYGNGRWGTKFSYIKGKTVAQIAYLGNPSGLDSFGDLYDFSRTSDKSFQWKAAYADPAKPYEIGIFGETGSLGYSGSELVPGLHLDNYNVVAPYVSKDPRPGSPGFRFEYASAVDSNPGYAQSATTGGALQSVGRTPSSWMIGSAYQMLFDNRAMANITYYHTNQNLAESGLTGLVAPTGPQSGGGPGLSYAFNNYIRAFTVYYVAHDQRPTYALKLWFSPPLWSRLK